MTLGQRVGELRHQKGWTQGVLANFAVTATPVISDVEKEKRRPTLGTIYRIARAFSITLSELFEGVDTVANS